MTDAPIIRVGLGTDLHRLVPGGPLRLAGVEIPFEKHLHGHSDGDVVLHAVTDALLGAMGLPDIGERFPDSDAAFRGADSAGLLGAVMGDLSAAGFVVGNVDLVIHAESPKLSGHKGAMRRRVAELVGVVESRVSVKAKTSEGVDAVGRGEAIGCCCVVGLCRG